MARIRGKCLNIRLSEKEKKALRLLCDGEKCSVADLFIRLAKQFAYLNHYENVLDILEG